jgi:hypothetical protein
MPDSIIIKKVLIESSNIDSMNAKISALKIAIDKNLPDTSFGIWIPLGAAILGGLLVLAGQARDRNAKRKQERINSLLEIYAFCRKLEALMKNNYRELAMAKVHVEYWWYCHNLPSSIQYQNKYYEEHLRSLSFAREIEKRIGDTKADFIGHVYKFHALRNVDQSLISLLNEISDLTNAKAKTYKLNLSYEEVRSNLVDKDEADLRETYYQNLTSFKTINDALQNIVES